MIHKSEAVICNPVGSHVYVKQHQRKAIRKAIMIRRMNEEDWDSVARIYHQSLRKGTLPFRPSVRLMKNGMPVISGNADLYMN